MFIFAGNFIECLELLGVYVSHASRKGVHLKLLDVSIHLVIFSHQQSALLRREEMGVVISHILGLSGDAVCEFRYFYFWHQYFLLSVYEIVRTGNVHSFPLLEHLLLNFFSDVDVVVLPPLAGLYVIRVAVVMPTVRTALVDQQRIEVIWRLIDVAIRQLYLLLNLLDLCAIALDSFFQALLIVVEQPQERSIDLLLEGREDSGVVKFVLDVHAVHLRIQEAMSLA